MLSLVESPQPGELTSLLESDQSNNDTVIRFDPTGVPTVDPWNGIGVDYFVSNLWTGVATGSPTVEYSAQPVQFSTSGWTSPKQEGSNQSVQSIHVTNASSSGPNQTAIASVFGKILTAVNANPQSACSTWLQGNGTAAAVLIQALLTENNFGHGVFNIVNKEAFTFGTNPDKSPTGIPTNYAVTVNDNGAFFNSSFSVGKRGYPGNGLEV